MSPYFGRGKIYDGPVSDNFPVRFFELAMLREMGNIDFNDLLPIKTKQSTNRIEELNAERACIEGQIEEMEAQILKGESVARWSNLINKSTAKLDVVKKSLEDEKDKEANPLSEIVGDFKGLLAAIADQPLRETRIRLRSAIRRLVKRIDVLVVKGKDRKFVYAQIWWNDPGIPSYHITINYRQGRRATNWERPPFWESERLIGGETFDLRKEAALMAFQWHTING